MPRRGRRPGRRRRATRRRAATIPGGDTPMRIRTGYEIAYECPQPTPMLLMLSVHPSRAADQVDPRELAFAPPIRARDYRDGFGNVCARIQAPTGRLVISPEPALE